MIFTDLSVSLVLGSLEIPEAYFCQDEEQNLAHLSHTFLCDQNKLILSSWSHEMSYSNKKDTDSSDRCP